MTSPTAEERARKCLGGLLEASGRRAYAELICDHGFGKRDTLPAALVVRALLAFEAAAIERAAGIADNFRDREAGLLRDSDGADDRAADATWVAGSIAASIRALAGGEDGSR